MTPLPDRVVLLGLVITIGLCFALAFWTARLAPPPEGPLLWRQPAPAAPGAAPQPRLRGGEAI